MHLFQLVAGFLTYAFIIASMLGAGLGLTIAEITAPLRKINLALRALAINFVVVPALAYALATFFNLIPSMHTGIMIIALCAGAPFLPKIVKLAKGNQTPAISQTILLTTTTIIFLPIILPLVLPGLYFDPWKIVRSLFMLMLLPLALGLWVKAWRSHFAAIIKPRIDNISAISLIIAGIFGLWIDFPIFVNALGTGIYTFISLLISGAMLTGFMLGGSDFADRIVMSLGAGARNITAALLVAVTIGDRSIVAVIIIGSLVEFVLLAVVAKVFARKARA